MAEEIRAKGVPGMAIAAHVARTEDSKALIEKVTKEFGRLNIVTSHIKLTEGALLPEPAGGMGYEGAGRGIDHHKVQRTKRNGNTGRSG
ncbi:MAG: hypothetical protein V1897_16535 [Pseudomonadota bacterium]